MRRNLDSTGGLIVAEAVMMGLAPVMGRGEAHHVVHHACDVALAEGVPLAEALLRDPQVAAKLSARRGRAADRPRRLSRRRRRLHRPGGGAA